VSRVGLKCCFINRDIKKESARQLEALRPFASSELSLIKKQQFASSGEHTAGETWASVAFMTARCHSAGVNREQSNVYKAKPTFECQGCENIAPIGEREPSQLFCLFFSTTFHHLAQIVKCHRVCVCTRVCVSHFDERPC